MTLEPSIPFPFPPATGPWLLPVAGAVALTALWVWLHRRLPPARRAWGRGAQFLLRVGAGFAALTAWAMGLQHLLSFATKWPLPLLLLGGALAVETVHALYGLERQSAPPPSGACLAPLRATLVLLLLFMLCQPVKTFTVHRKLDRYVAVLLDGSASMRIADTGLPPAERLRLAEFLGLGKVRRIFTLERTAGDLRAARREIQAQLDNLPPAGALAAAPEGHAARMQKKTKPLADTLRRVQKNLAASRAALAAPATGGNATPDGGLRNRLNAIVATVDGDILARCDEALKALAEAATAKPGPPTVDALKKAQETLARAVTAMQQAEAAVTAAGTELDLLAYAALPAETKKAVDAVAAMNRLELAAKLLNQPGGPGAGGGRQSLLDRLADDYGLKLYTFAGATAETSLKKMRAAGDGKPAAAPAAGEGRESQATDLVAAFQKAMGDIPADQFAGVLLLSDGRHNAAGSAEEIARRLGHLQIPVCPVSFGSSTHPPRDAAIAGVEAPELIYTGDRFVAKVEVKLDGLADQDVVIQLRNGKEVVDSRTLKAGADASRQQIELGAKPKVAGFHSYTVVIPPLPGEVTTANNHCALPVTVSDDKLKLLLVDGRPRWEFRYLKNLFAGRDPAVSLQYLLLNPDRAEGQAEPAKIAAAAARPAGECEATLLPATEEEWLKFDVIILGDVDPKALGEAGQKALRRFVATRGGTLVVIAGPLFMPHAYAGTPLAELLPVVFTAGTQPVTGGPEDSFRFELTQEGRSHPIMQLAAAPERSRNRWNTLPPMYWRHPLRDTKPGAAVLAYAHPLLAPDFLRAASTDEIPSETVLRQRREFERANALLVAQNYAGGRVLFAAADQSWRLRYQSGDTYHHRHWGQILRWGTADKLLYGAAGVRVGTDKCRYAPGEPVRLRARLSRADYSPVTNAAVSAVIRGGDGAARRHKLAFVPDSAGLYEARVDGLPEGDYTVELETNAKLEGKLPAGAFAVVSSLAAEMVELAPDTGLLNRLATATGGELLEPARIQEAATHFGPPSLVQEERRQYDLWNSWFLLLAITAVAGAEWALRKKASLP